MGNSTFPYKLFNRIYYPIINSRTTHCLSIATVKSIATDKILKMLFKHSFKTWFLFEKLQLATIFYHFWIYQLLDFITLVQYWLSSLTFEVFCLKFSLEDSRYNTFKGPLAYCKIRLYLRFRERVWAFRTNVYNYKES